MIEQLPTLGAGLGYRDTYRAEILTKTAKVDFLEIIADHYLDSHPLKRDQLSLLAEENVLIPHGLNLNLGGVEGPDLEYLDRFAELVNRLNPPWWSEHIAFTRADGREIGHLAPLPFNGESLDVLERNIRLARERTDVPLILENITYTFPMPGSDRDEASFLSELVNRTGCGLLLDVTNLHVNATNHGFNAYEFLDRMPLEHVVQLHFTGGHDDEGYLIDSHSAPTPPEVWRLLEHVLARAPVKGVILERDENLPPIAELIAEVDRVRAMMRKENR